MTDQLEITSTANPRIKAALGLRDRREREQTGLTIVDGAREIRRAIAAGIEVVEAFVHEPEATSDDATAARLLVERGDLRVRTPELERASPLEALGFHVHGRTHHSVERAGCQNRRPVRV